MKLAKRMLALTVAVMLVMAVLVVPASATLTPLSIRMSVVL